MLIAAFGDTVAEQIQRLSFLEYYIEVGAVLTAALSGMLASRRKRMDLVGTYIVAFVNAFGGGTLRDVLLNRRPLFWVQFPEYPLAIFVLTLLFLYIPWVYRPANPIAQRLFDGVDACGLALFSISGASYALEYALHPFIAALLGVITGVFGGILRDVLLAEIPIIFQTRSSLYATCAFVGCWVLILGLRLDLNPTMASFIAATMIVVFRLLSVQYCIRLPAPRYPRVNIESSDRPDAPKEF